MPYSIVLLLRVRGGGCAASRAERAPVGDSIAHNILGDTSRARSPTDLLVSLTRLDDRLVERLRADDIRVLRIAWLLGSSANVTWRVE